MIDVADHPDPAHDPALVAVVLVEGDDPDDFAIDVDDEVVAARTEFSWTVRRLEASTTRWTEWAAKILAAYPWVGEFHPEDSNEKYRDGVRYVLLCIECDGDSSIELAVEMQDIKAKWGFS